MIGYVKDFDSNKTMSFKVNDNRLLKKYNKIWEKNSNLLNIEFDSQPVYGDGDKSSVKWGLLTCSRSGFNYHFTQNTIF